MYLSSSLHQKLPRAFSSHSTSRSPIKQAQMHKHIPSLCSNHPCEYPSGQGKSHDQALPQSPSTMKPRQMDGWIYHRGVKNWDQWWNQPQTRRRRKKRDSMGRSLQRFRQEVINIRTEPMARGRITGRGVSRCRRKSRKKHQGDFQLSNQE